MASLQSMAELDEISRVQGLKWGVHGVQTLFFRVHQAALDTYIDLIAHNTRVQGLIFGVHVELLQSLLLCSCHALQTGWVGCCHFYSFDQFSLHFNETAMFLADSCIFLVAQLLWSVCREGRTRRDLARARKNLGVYGIPP